MFWSKARKIRRLEGELAAQASVLEKELKMKIAAQESDKSYRKLAAERLQHMEDLAKARDLVLKELEIKTNDYAILSSTYENTRHVIEKKDEEIESSKLAYEHERKMRDEFERELGKVRGELAALRTPALDSMPQWTEGRVIPGRDDPVIVLADPLAQVDNFSRDGSPERSES